MRTPASIAKHPIHPMLVTIPIGLWIFSLVADIVRVSGATDPVWAVLALYTMAGGIAGALLAAVPGFVDLLSLLPGPRKTALTHMAINLTVVTLYVVNVWMRWSNPADLEMPFWLSVASVGLLAISGWLGGKMVYEHGVAVDIEGITGAGRTR